MVSSMVESEPAGQDGERPLSRSGLNLEVLRIPLGEPAAEREEAAARHCYRESLGVRFRGYTAQPDPSPDRSAAPSKENQSQPCQARPRIHRRATTPY